MATLTRDDDRLYQTSSHVERRKLNWSAIVAGVVSALGLYSLLMLFGSAVGASAFDPYEIAKNDQSYTMPIATIAWLALSMLGSAFFGAWVAGHWANLYEGEDALIHGALVWALCSVILAMGIGSLVNYGTQAASAASNFASAMPNKEAVKGQSGKLVYDSLADAQYRDFVLNRARAWAPSRPAGQATEVTADQREDNEDMNAAYPDRIPNDDSLINFVSTQTGMTKAQAKDFLEAEKQAIAQEKSASKARWNSANINELNQAERVRKATERVAWTVTALAFLSLAAALGGAYLGWHQRYEGPDDAVVRNDDNPKTPRV